MKKALLVIGLLTILLFSTTRAQTAYDTQAMLIPVIKTSSATIFPEQRYLLRGYVIWKTVTAPGGRPATTKIGYLWSDRKRKIQPPYIVAERDGEIPVNGWDF